MNWKPRAARRNRRRVGQFAHVILSELTEVRRQSRCLLCGVRETGNAELRRHYLQHHRERPYTCPAPHCGKPLAGKAELEKHWGYHLNDKPFQCDECPKRFAWLKRLEEHQHVHRGTKPHACQECGKEFRQRSSLKYHVQIRHERRFPFACAACPKVFATERQRTKHTRMHTGERPHACSRCPKAFTQRAVLRMHARTVHRDGTCSGGEADDGQVVTGPARAAGAQPTDDSAVIVEELNVALNTDTGHGPL
ncbi:gastrula zinc finger protein XlCGF49.1-like [Pollicipes pollicipes]|uniref:gastrula zinc finger protein XlCGF49.1-like n=1 Tax=Pollicipes pollicipes TaxID=41117 RepID=UPI001884C3C6|nr:gastrula zinc finger protein XlCGF49.1-like [Pollicipes pollicipes]